MRISDWSSGVCSSDLPTVSRSNVYTCNSNNSCFGGQLLDPDDGNVLLSSLYRGGCSSNWYGFYRGFLDRVCMRLPDPVRDRKSVVSGKSVSVRVVLGVRGIIKKKKYIRKDDTT